VNVPAQRSAGADIVTARVVMKASAGRSAAGTAAAAAPERGARFYSGTFSGRSPSSGRLSRWWPCCRVLHCRSGMEGIQVRGHVKVRDADRGTQGDAGITASWELSRTICAPNTRRARPGSKLPTILMQCTVRPLTLPSAPYAAPCPFRLV
jgi:hypothetical protein